MNNGFIWFLLGIICVAVVTLCLVFKNDIVEFFNPTEEEKQEEQVQEPEVEEPEAQGLMSIVYDMPIYC